MILVSHRQSGFTLLEAIVAIVLVASSGMALFSWINGNLITLGRVQDNNARTEATQNALELMESINPMLRPSGQTSLGAYQLTWEAKQTGPLTDSVNYPYGIGLWQFALFDTQVSLIHRDGRAWFSFPLRQVGYKRVRSVEF